MPEWPHPWRGPSPGRASTLPRSWRRAHHLDVPHMRSDGVRPAAQHPLHGASRALRLYGSRPDEPDSAAGLAAAWQAADGRYARIAPSAAMGHTPGCRPPSAGRAQLGWGAGAAPLARLPTSGIETTGHETRAAVGPPPRSPRWRADSGFASAGAAMRGCASAKTPPGPVWRYRLNLPIGCQSEHFKCPAKASGVATMHLNHKGDASPHCGRGQSRIEWSK